ncbi:MAG: hypothetical protein AB7W59_00185 [Acidimicrobiia bacterium]
MAKMIHVQVPSGVTPRQIEGFPADCERSVKGSLHVKPGTLLVTEGELEHLRKHHKDVARRLRVVGPVKEPAAPAPSAAPAAITEPEPTPEPTPKASGGRSGRRGGSGSSSSDD